ncbi:MULTISPECIES: RDD family protein [Niastella]|uniref:RDD family protein n=1 Tax=Niastella soli TaxID=2821487 RepID=A0ABS3YWT7_9BACT|nr:RDD family protein [Niastella soli]MBO9202299.1 RDD family protein [Niastella soli]
MEDILRDFESPPPASKFIRWLASFVDYLIYALVTGVIIHFSDGRWLTIKGNGEWVGLYNDIINNAFVVIPWLVILPGYETFNKGQTIGKVMFGIRVLNHDGSKLDIVSSIVRHLFDFVDFLPFGGMVGVATANSNKKAQRVGDLVAKTIVVQANG